MKMFDVQTKCQLASLIGVSPSEMDNVISNRGHYYSSYKLPKPDGTFRTLQVPGGALRALQDKVKIYILDSIHLLDCVHGGIQGRSVVTNALPHVGKQIVFTLDIKDFFPTVAPHTVQAIFERLGFGHQASRALVDITTWAQQLPQGAPTSTGVANLAMNKADARLQTLAQEHSFSYTRYVDDLTFSGGSRLLKLRRLIQRIVQEEGFTLKTEKIRTMHAGQRQVVTKLTVNRKLNLPKEKISEIRKNVLAFAANKGGKREDAAFMRGQLSWLSSINPAVGLRFRRRARISQDEAHRA